MTKELINEKIIEIGCGGCHLAMLTKDIITNEQYIYECGENYAEQISELDDIPILRKSKKIKNYKILRIPRLLKTRYLRKSFIDFENLIFQKQVF